MKDFIKGASPVLPCKDVNETVEYYRDKLGFDKTWTHEDIYGGAYNGSSEFHFQKTQSEIHPVMVYCFVDNADAVYEFLKSNNVEILVPPEDQVFGLRDFNFKDLNGNIICFASEIKK